MAFNNVVSQEVLREIHPEAWNRWFNRAGAKPFRPRDRVWYADIQQDGTECEIVEQAAEGMWLVKFDFSGDTEEVPDEFLYFIRSEDDDDKTS